MTESRLAFALAAGVVAQALAGPAARADEQDRVLESARFLGRGGTFVAAPDSDEATRGNPAALAESTAALDIRWAQLDVFVGKNTLGSISDVQGLNGNASAVSLLQTFANDFGKRQYARVQLAPLAVRVGSFELMPFATTSDFIDLRDPTLPDVHFHSDSLYGVALGYSLALTKTLSLGLTVRPAHRIYFDGDVQFSDLLQFVDNSNTELSSLFQQREGTEVGVDVGFLWQPAQAWRFGLLVENAGYTSAFGGAPHPPPAEKQRVDVGTCYRIDLQPWHLDLSSDLQDAVNPDHLDDWRLVHLGTELGRSYFTKDNDAGFQVGVNEGYLTTGAFVDAYLFRLNVAYYAVELGEYAGQRADRRWGATLMTSTTF